MILLIKKSLAKKAKGVNKKLKPSEFAVLSNKKIIRHNMKRIQNKIHRLGTYNVFVVLMIKGMYMMVLILLHIFIKISVIIIVNS